MSETYGSENPQVEPVEMKKKDLVDDIMVLNSLAYTLPSSLSAAVSRVNKISYADKTNYNQNDGEIVIRVVSSSDFFKPQTSYLTFDFQANPVNSGFGVLGNASTPGSGSSAPVTPIQLVFGAGGALSLFRRLVLESKSGTNLLYKDQASVIMTQLLYANNPSGYILDMARCGQMLVNNNGEPFSNMSSPAGATPLTTANLFAVDPTQCNINDVTLGSYAATTGAFTSQTQKVVIPLCWLDPFFDTACMHPSSLASGLRIRLALNSPQQAMVLVNATATAQSISVISSTSGTGTNTTTSVSSSPTITYNINNAQVVLDTYSLSPQIYSRLSQVSAAQGLDVTFKTHWYQSTNVPNQSTVNVEINKSVARALTMYMCQMPIPYPLYWDPNMTVQSNYIQYSSRLGSLVFPAPSALTIFTSPLNTTSDVQKYSQEFYHLYLVAIKKAGVQGSKYGPSTVRYVDFVNGFNMLSQTLERSSLDMSGIPNNNARSFSAQLKYVAAVNGLVNSYMEHVAVAKVFLKETLLKL